MSAFGAMLFLGFFMLGGASLFGLACLGFRNYGGK